MQIETAIETPAPVTARIPWEVACLMAAATSMVLGLYWDLAWHRSIGRDSFWTPAHVAIYLGGIMGGIAAAGSILPATFGRSARALSLRTVSARVWGFRGPLGAFVSAWGGIAMLTSAPFDNWWHNAYGLDVKVVSPPHILLLLGIVAVELGGLLLVQQLRANAPQSRGARLEWLMFYVGGMILSTIMITLEEFANRFTLHSALAYAVLSTGVPLIVLTIGGASGHRWGCTAVAGVYMLARLLQLWIFPLFPAEPKLGPVFIHVTHFIPTGFPILLMAPAAALDLLRARRSAALAGTAFLAALLAIEWPFAGFLMLPAARNWFFGMHYIPYQVNLPDPQWPYRFQPQESSLAQFCFVLAVGLGLAILSTRAGMALSARLARLRR